MRVIGGQFRSRLLHAPRGADTRPTSDRLRETLFNVLAPRFEQNPVFLDLYAGSGAVGIEALSRGAREAIFVEPAAAPMKELRGNLASLDIHGGFALEQRSVKEALPRLRETGRIADIIFLDPPWSSQDEYALALGLLGGECLGVLAPSAVVIAEHEKRHELQEHYGVLDRIRVLRQGDAALSFFAVTT